MLSDLYVPDDIDPANPKAKFAQSTPCKEGDSTKNHEECYHSDFESCVQGGEVKSPLKLKPASFDLRTITNSSRRGPRKAGAFRRHSKHHEQSEQLCETAKSENVTSTVTDGFIDEDELIFMSPPLTSSVVERCR